MSHMITGLGEMRIYDKESGELLLKGQMTGMTYKDEHGQVWKIKVTEPKKCPHCGKEI